MSSRRKPPAVNRPITGDPAHEPSAWLRNAVRHRMREALPVIGPLAEAGRSVVISLADPSPGGIGTPARDRWEWTCDRCGLLVTPGARLVPFVHPVPCGRGQVVIHGGLCEPCGLTEAGRDFVTVHARTRTSDDCPEVDA